MERKEEEDEANDSENVIINSPFQTRKGENNIPFRPIRISGGRLSHCRIALKQTHMVIWFSSREGPVASTFLVYQHMVVPSRGRTLVGRRHNLLIHLKCRVNWTLRQHLLMQAPALLRRNSPPEKFMGLKMLGRDDLITCWWWFLPLTAVGINGAAAKQTFHFDTSIAADAAEAELRKFMVKSLASNYYTLQ